MLKRITILAVIVSAFMLAGCKKEDGQTQQQLPPPMVIVHQVETKNVAPSEVFIGKVEAATKASITARVSGFLEQRLVNEGDMVKKNQILFVIERSQYQATVAQAEATLAQAQATEYNAGLQRDRGAALLKSAGISQAAYDNLESAYRIAVANTAAAKASLDSAKLNLSYTTVRSPIDGKVGLISYNVGETVSPTSGVLTTVMAQSPMYVSFNVTDRQIQGMRQKFAAGEELQAGQDITELVEMRITLSNGKPYNETGVMNFVDNTVGSLTDSLMMRAEFQNADGSLTNGQTVTVTIFSKEEQEEVIVPQAAILNDIGGKYVLVVKDDNTVEHRSVEVGTVLAVSEDTGNKTMQVITSGLKENERIIIDGVQKVRPGIPVQPMTQAEYDKMVEQSAQQAPANQ